MNIYEQQYMENKENVLNCMKKAGEFYKKILTGGFGQNITDEEREIYENKIEALECQYKNLENGEFTIVLVGEFSAGKSTFLNALMGERILPSFTNETTATVNFLKHKNRSENGESGCVYYNDGTKKIIDHADIQTISQYVSTESSEDVAKNISHLDLYLDSKFLENNVTLVDSPGLNGVADGHREITEEQIERSSASIFLFNANQPGSNSDFEFLRNLQKKVNSIICVLNQIDCIKEHEGQSVESVIKKLKENYKKMIPEAKTIPEIIPVAAYPALVARGTAKMQYNGKTEFTKEEKEKFEKESRLKAFEERLWRYLTQGEKAKQQLLAPIKQLEAQLLDIKEGLLTEQDTLNGKLGVEDLEEQKLVLEKQKEDLNQNLKDKKTDIRKEIKMHMDEILEKIDSDAEELKNKMAMYIEEWQDIEDIEPDNIQRTIQKKLDYISDDAIEDFQNDISNMILEYVNVETEAINDKLNENKFSFTLKGSVEISDITLNVASCDEKINKIEEKINKLDIDDKNNENDLSEIMEKQRKRQELEKELADKQQAKEHYEEVSATCIPDIQYRTESRWEEKPSGGILGGLKRFLVGAKMERVEETVEDSRERDEYVKMRNAKIQKFDYDIEKLQNELRDMPIANAEAKEKIGKKIAEKRRALVQEKQVIRKTFMEKSKGYIERTLKRKKREVNDFIDDNVHKFRKAFRKESRSMMDIMVNVIIDIIENGVKSQLESLEKEIMLIQKRIEDAVSNRDTRLNELEREISEIDPVLIETFELETKLDAIQEDTIQQVELITEEDVVL